MKYEKEVRIIWKEQVPKSGQSLTVEGELIRVIERLRWEAMGTANMN